MPGARPRQAPVAAGRLAAAVVTITRCGGQSLPKVPVVASEQENRRSVHQSRPGYGKGARRAGIGQLGPAVPRLAPAHGAHSVQELM
jgi:hypothetical protein